MVTRTHKPLALLAALALMLTGLTVLLITRPAPARAEGGGTVTVTAPTATPLTPDTATTVTGLQVAVDGQTDSTSAWVQVALSTDNGTLSVGDESVLPTGLYLVGARDGSGNRLSSKWLTFEGPLATVNAALTAHVTLTATSAATVTIAAWTPYGEVTPAYFPVTGHFYEFAPCDLGNYASWCSDADGSQYITWNGAQSAAAAMPLVGANGYLAQIGNAETNTFIRALGGDFSQAWIGASNGETGWQWTDGALVDMSIGGAGWADGGPGATIKGNGKWDSLPLDSQAVSNYVVEYGTTGANSGFDTGFDRKSTALTAGSASSAPPSGTSTPPSGSSTPPVATPTPTTPAPSTPAPSTPAPSTSAPSTSRTPSQAPLPPNTSDNTSDLQVSNHLPPMGSQITLTATGFQPGSIVDFWLHSTPRYLGSAIADADGIARLPATLPSDFTGAHHVQSLGLGLSGQPRNLMQPITIAAPAASTPLAATGADLTWQLPLALICLAAGGLLLLLTLRRPRTAAAHQ